LILPLDRVALRSLEVSYCVDIDAIDRAALMRRALVIFRETYKYPQIKFSDIGRRCFAWALRKVWEEARESADPKPSNYPVPCPFAP
jgi:hypothetical protein